MAKQNVSLKTKIALRNDTAASWTTNNPILLKGEAGIETDTRRFKFGDGIATWTNLEYASADSAEVISVNGQKGAVVLTSSNIAEGTNQYYTQARFDTALTAKSTTNLKEGTNLYYTDARVKAFIENANNVFVLDGGNATGN